MIRLAILGAGRIGAVHAGNATASSEIELVGVADIVDSAAAALSERLGIPVLGVDAVFEDPSIDAVLIATATDTHADLSERAASAGKAIFCEKPVDLDVTRVRQCLARVEAAGVPFFVGFNRRFDPSFAGLRERSRAGAIGELELLSITSRDPAPPPLAYIQRSGGLFRDMMIHDLDMACWLLDEVPVEVHAVASVMIDPAIGEAGDFDTAFVTLEFPSGRIGQISNSRRATYGYDQRIELHGSSGMLLADNRRDTTLVQAGASGYIADPAQPFFLERYGQAYAAELAAFANCVRMGSAASPGGADGLRALILADAATLSARSGVPVKVNLG
ncbi:MAG: inositol 2-dehydrogenase [Alphaproteobacteria bacterium]|jgi:myo-inositol 2-dehydrogenase / D-chiro-inositol 1-dehydrogenase|nr:inositol 2-dehydrogenase [Alphaproteobacteria bacterium]